MATYNMFKDSNFTKVKRSWLGLLNMVMVCSVSDIMLRSDKMITGNGKYMALGCR
jgi:hypothetical protein